MLERERGVPVLQRYGVRRAAVAVRRDRDGRFRRAIGEDGLELLLKFTIETAVQIKAIKPAELERAIVDTTVMAKAIAHSVDSRLLEIARHKIVSAAKRAGITLKQTFAKEGKTLRRKAGGYTHLKQVRRLKRIIKRQRTILGVVMREAQHKRQSDRQATAAGGVPSPSAKRPQGDQRPADVDRVGRAHPHPATPRQE